MERKMAHRLVNVAMWPAIMKCANMVQRTFQVQMRRKARVAFLTGRSGEGVWAEVGEVNGDILTRWSESSVSMDV